MEQGQTLESGEHTVEVVDAREANCYIEGKTGEEKCSVCDKVLKENKVIQSSNINMKIIFAKIVEE